MGTFWIQSRYCASGSAPTVISCVCLPKKHTSSKALDHKTWHKVYAGTTTKSRTEMPRERTSLLSGILLIPTQPFLATPYLVWQRQEHPFARVFLNFSLLCLVSKAYSCKWSSQIIKFHRCVSPPASWYQSVYHPLPYCQSTIPSNHPLPYCLNISLTTIHTWE